jgi:hypothetical protein
LGRICRRMRLTDHSASRAGRSRMTQNWLARPPLVLRQAQDEEIGDCIGADGTKKTSSC